MTINELSKFSYRPPSFNRSLPASLTLCAAARGFTVVVVIVVGGVGGWVVVVVVVMVMAVVVLSVVVVSSGAAVMGNVAECAKSLDFS